MNSSTRQRSRPTSHGEQQLVFVLFAVLGWAVGLGLLAVRHVAVRDSAAAESWIETPCVMEKCEYARSETRTHGPGTLLVRYRYSWEGQEYVGDHLDPTPGTVGDDQERDQQIYRECPVGATAICYVNPHDPAQAVLHRGRIASHSRSLLMISFPFLCIGAGFTLGCLQRVASARHAATTASERVRLFLAQPMPRRLGALTWATVVAGPAGAQAVWLFVVAFAYMFVFLEGPANYARLLRGSPPTQLTPATVTKVCQTSLRELGTYVYEYEFQFEVEGRTYTGVSATHGRKFERGKAVTVEYEVDAPENAVIKGARRGSLTWVHSSIPLGVLLLLLFGLAGMTRANLHAARLLRRGHSATARRGREAGSSSAGTASPFMFEAQGQHYAAN